MEVIIMSDKNPPSSSAVRSYTKSSGIDKTTRKEEAFHATSLNPLYDPRCLKGGVRESCDSASQPNSQAIAIGFDVTGSMSSMPYWFIRQGGFLRFIEMIEGRDLGYDPHILFSAIADSMFFFGERMSSKAPLQVTQFESDTKLIEQLTGLLLEDDCGGANHGEGYQLFWYFLANHTKIDCYEKRRRPGIAISIGDDTPHEETKRREIEIVFGDSLGSETSELTDKTIRDKALEKWNLFHISVASEDGWPWDHGQGKSAKREILGRWKELLANKANYLPNRNLIAPAMVTIMRIQNGMNNKDAIAMIQDDSTKAALKTAFEDFEPYKNEVVPGPGNNIDFY
jgi:hypothetical protein